MPELPEVETIVRDLEKVLVGQTITKATVLNTKTVAPLASKTFETKLKNFTVTTVARRAKLIIISLEKEGSEVFLLTHLKMTGQLIYTPPSGDMVIGGHPQKNGATNLPNKYTRVVLIFKTGGVLYFNDMRKFGWMRLKTKPEKDKVLTDYGVEPLSRQFTTKKLSDLFKRFPSRSIKKTLLDQHHVVGLGNIYIDEACFLSRLRPDIQVSTLSKEDTLKLKNNIATVLKLSIKHRGTSAKDYLTADGTPGGFAHHLQVYGRAGETCHHCHEKIIKIKHAGRGTHFCPKCQK